MKEELQCVASSSYSLLSFYSSFPSPSLSPSFLSFLAALIYNVKGNIFNLFFSIYSDSLCKSLPFVAQSVRICLQCRRPGFSPWLQKIPWRRKWQPTLVSLPGKSHGQRNLVDCSPWGRKESGTIEQLTHTHRPGEFLFQYPTILPFHTVHGVLKARILTWFAIPFSPGPHSIRPLPHDPPVLGGPIWHGLVSPS